MNKINVRKKHIRNKVFIDHKSYVNNLLLNLTKCT